MRDIGKHSIIPEEILKLKISPTAKYIFGLLLFSELAKNNILWDVKTLSDTLDKSIQKVYLAINSLLEKGAIYSKKTVTKRLKINDKVKRHYNSTTYYLINPNILNNLFSILRSSMGVFSNKNELKSSKEEIGTYDIKNNTQEKELKLSNKELGISDLGYRIKKQITQRNNPPNKLLEEIFSIPNLPKHKQFTKIYKESAHMLWQLKNGRLYRFSLIDQKWLETFNISKRVLTQKLQDAQIVNIFKDIAKSYTLGYEPSDKSILPKRLPDILYNPRSQKSLFLKVAANGVNTTSSKAMVKQESKLTEQEQEVLTELKQAIETCLKGKREITKQEHTALIKTAKTVIKEFNDTVKHMGIAPWEYLFGFVKDYTRWIIDEFEGRLDNALWFGKEGRYWDQYVRERGFHD